MTRPTHEGKHSDKNLRPLREDELRRNWHRMTDKERKEKRDSIQAMYDFWKRYDKHTGGMYKWQLELIEHLEQSRET